MRKGVSAASRDGRTSTSFKTLKIELTGPSDAKTFNGDFAMGGK
jgi:hypothetical protein